jgi:prepilin-type N-terminal cleavage/methylation domain-containing protein
MKKESGFTLVELMVVVSITVLLLAWGIPAYSKWNTRHTIEGEMVHLYSDLQSVRMDVYSNKVVSGISWGGGTSIAAYTVGYITSKPVPVPSEGTLKYTITSSVAQNSVSFDGRGFLNIANPGDPTSITFYVAPSYGAYMDCVAVTSTRITLGKMNSGSCAPK